MAPRKPAKLYFPVGVPAALKALAKKTGYSEQHSALLLWQFQRQIAHKIIKKGGALPRTQLVAPLNAKLLKKVIRDKTGYVKHLQALLDDGILELCSKHLAGFRSRVYRYGKAYDPLDKLEVYELTKSTVINAHLRHYKQADTDWYFAQRRAYIQSFDFDYEKAERLMRAESNKRGMVWLEYMTHNLIEIQAGYRGLFKDSNGREHHPFLRLPKSIRESCITYKGLRLIQLDLPAAQPMLLWAKFKKMIPESEGQEYRTALQIDFYLYFARKWELLFGRLPSRKQVKKAICFYLFGEDHRESKMHVLFESCFPSLAEQVKEVKKPCYTQMSTLLQKEESSLIFDACKDFTDQQLTPFFTVHDCVAVLPKHAVQCEQILISKLQNKGIDWHICLNK